MDIPLRFDPSVEFKRLLARPQIDEEGIVYADAFDRVGTARTGEANLLFIQARMH